MPSDTPPKPARPAGDVLPFRRMSRELALQLLFQFDIGGLPCEPQVFEDFFAQAAEAEPFCALSPRDLKRLRKHATDTALQIWPRRAELDAVLERYSDNWKLSRMAAVDRNVLRLALYEMLHCPKIPVAVSINEAVDIARHFGTSESSRFVNGVLDGIRRRAPEVAAVPRGVAAAADPTAAAAAPPPATDAPEALKAP